MHSKYYQFLRYVNLLLPVLILLLDVDIAAADNCTIGINPEDCQNTAWTVATVAAIAASIAGAALAFGRLAIRKLGPLIRKALDRLVKKFKRSPKPRPKPKPIDDYVANTKPGKTSKTAQRSKPGGLNQANNDFDELAGSNPVKTYPNGTRSTQLPDGTTISVRPNSTYGSPTLQINQPGQPTIKVRYE